MDYIEQFQINRRLKRIGLYEFKRKMSLWFNIYPYHIKPGTVIPHCASPGFAE
jgi:hypothetical protein